VTSSQSRLLTRPGETSDRLDGDNLVHDNHVEKQLGWARYDARPGSGRHSAGTVETGSDEGGGDGDDRRSCFPVAGPGR
jgi:hypothetical protein